jgi:hypothetical protein
METMNDKIVMPNLVELDMPGVKSFPWSKIDAPQLIRVVAYGGSREAVDFLCLHQTIRHLTLKESVSEVEFRKLAAALPNLESLQLGGAVGGFFAATKVVAESPPFPNLSHLSLDLRKVGKVSLECFQHFLRPRYLLIQVKEEDCRVKKLKFLCMKDYTTNLDEVEWTRSALLDTCTQTRVGVPVKNMSALEFRWVE